MYLVCTRMCNNETRQYKYPHDIKHFINPDFVKACIINNGVYYYTYLNCTHAHSKCANLKKYVNLQQEGE